MFGRGPSWHPRDRTPLLPTFLTRSDYGLRMPKNVKWGLVLIAQLPITYVLIAVNRRFTFDAEQHRRLQQLAQVRDAGTITLAERDTLRQRPLTQYAAS